MRGRLKATLHRWTWAILWIKVLNLSLIAVCWDNPFSKVNNNKVKEHKNNFQCTECDWNDFVDTISTFLADTGWPPTLSSGTVCPTWRTTSTPCISATTTASRSKGTRTTRGIRWAQLTRLCARSFCWCSTISPCSLFCYLSLWWDMGGRVEGGRYHSSKHFIARWMGG